MAYEFKFPDIGEGITEGELLAWKVQKGDMVAEDQTLAEVETDKAVVELPSPRAGRVAQLHAAEGDMIQVGQVVVTIDEEAGAPGAAVPPTAEEPPPTPPAAAASVPPAPPTTPPAPPEEAAAVPYTGSVVGRLEEAPEEEEVQPQLGAPAPEEAEPGVLAMPSVRALARELGVDLHGIRGTGPGGRILKQDVEDVAQAAAYGVAAPEGAATKRAEPAPSVAGAAPAPAERAAVQPTPGQGEAAAEVTPRAPAAEGVVPSPEEGAEAAPVLGGVIEQDSFGPVERVPFRGVRRTMARHMAESVAKQAQVTTMDEADVTIIRRIREKERTVAAERGVRLTYLAFAVKACTASLKRFPRLNAVLEESGDEFLLKRYYNIGIAIDTKSGLVVPNIKDADKKSIFQIAEEIVELVDRADERRLELHELHGGTFTITNYGAIGGVFATPVINYPEVAILGMGRVRDVPVLREDKVVSRLMLPLSLTFDHRLIDGAEATRFLNLVMGYLEDPDLLLLEGA